MNYIQNIFLLRDIHKEIKKERTGGLMAFTRKMRMTTGTMRRKLEELREMGADLQFDRTHNTYYYRNDFELKVEVSYDE